MPIMDRIIQPRICYIHKETTNQSFLDMHHYLKSIGIQNNDFFLALLDPGLSGVDPRDPSLPTSMKARIMNECRLNYWYFLREVVRISESGGGVDGGVRYKLHRGNLAMNFLFTLNFNQFVEMPRQHGKTVGAVCRYLWVYNFGSSNSEIMFMHKDHPGSKANLAKLKQIRDNLPSYLQMSSGIGVDGKPLKVPNTIEKIENPYNHNIIRTYPSARSRSAADNLGRGMTISNQYYDEFAFLPFNETVYLAATPAFSKASESARRNNSPYGILVTTTPGDLTTESGAFAYDARNKATPFSERFYDYTPQQLHEIEQSNKNSPFFLVSFTYQQLGSGQDYFKEMVRQMLQNWPKIRREVMLEWATVSGNCPFSQEDLDIIRNFIREPIRVIPFGRIGQYEFKVYEDIDTRFPPIVGVDVAGATFNDSSAITVIDSKTTRVTATLNCNYIPQDDLAQVLYELASKYLPNCVINIERNGGFGRAVVSMLAKTSVKRNLYWEIKEKVFEEQFDGIRMQKQKKRVRVYGIDSTASVRARLIEILQERVMYHKDKFVAKIILDEMQGMEVKKNGKVEHSSQTHDDQVFSYLMALYVWYDGENLMENFHIVKNTLKTDDEEELAENEIESLLEKREKLSDSTFNQEPETELAKQLEWVEQNSKIITSKDLQDGYFSDVTKARDMILTTNHQVRENYARSMGIDPDMLINTSNLDHNITQIPQSMFDLDVDEDEQKYSVLQGNLSGWWDKV